jgi:uncharacterized protein YggE
MVRILIFSSISKICLMSVSNLPSWLDTMGTIEKIQKGADMKDKTNTLLIIVLILAFWFSPRMGNQPALAASDDTTEQPRYISVTGDAEVRVVPDEVIFNLGVETNGKNLYVVKRQNDQIVERVLKLAESYGIPSQHIQTDYIYVDQGYYCCGDQEDYIVRKTIVITLRDITKFEDLLTSMLEAGVTNVHGIEFRTTELRKHKDHARALAIQAAKEKAIAMAGGLDQKVGDPTSINENHVGWYSWYSSWWGRWSSGSMAQNVVQEVGNLDWTGDGSAAPGQISVNARVSVTFEIDN